jgi:hypothetical protein
MFFSRFWVGGTGRELVRRFGRDHVNVSIYLFTGPSAHQSGLYYLPALEITEHTGISAPKVRRILADLDRIGFARYDESASMIWVVTMARWQISEALRDRDNRVRGLRRYLKSLPRSVLVDDFRRHYALEIDADPSPSEAPSEPHRSPAILSLSQSPPFPAGSPGRPARKAGGAR